MHAPWSQILCPGCGGVILCELCGTSEWARDEYYERVILKDSINNFIISGCCVWCILFGCMFFGFLLRSILMYLCMSHSIVPKFGGRGGDVESWLVV